MKRTQHYSIVQRAHEGYEVGAEAKFTKRNTTNIVNYAVITRLGRIRVVRSSFFFFTE
jgi:hypothetical protein